MQAHSLARRLFRYSRCVSNALLHHHELTANKLSVEMPVFIALSVLTALTPALVKADCDYTSVCVIEPGDDVSEIVNNGPAGSTFLFRSGTHRPSSFNSGVAADTLIEPKDGQTFNCESGAVISGAQVIAGSWIREGNLYFNDEVPVPKDGINCGSSDCVVPGRPIRADGRPVNDLQEDIFVNGRLYLRVENKQNVNNQNALFDDQEIWAGTFFQDSSGRAYLPIEPDGTVEISRKNFAFRATANDNDYVENVTINNCIIEKFASPAQLGAVEALFTKNWQLINVTVRYNHGGGLRAGESTVVIGGSYSFNGHIGVSASAGPAADLGGNPAKPALAGNIELRDAEIAWNNWAGYNYIWEAGGVKLLKMDGVEIVGNHVHHNIGNGIWMDTEVTRVNIDTNNVHDNTGMGILIESNDACKSDGLCDYENNYTERVTNNRVADNARVIEFDPVLAAAQDHKWWWGAEILIQNSSGYLISGNDVVVSNGQAIGIIDQGDGNRGFGPRASTDNRVEGNSVLINTAPGQSRESGEYEWWQGYSGADQDTGTPISNRNLFKANRYATSSGTSPHKGYWRFDLTNGGETAAYTWSGGGHPLPSDYEPCSTFNGGSPRVATQTSGSCN